MHDEWNTRTSMCADSVSCSNKYMIFQTATIHCHWQQLQCSFTVICFSIQTNPASLLRAQQQPMMLRMMTTALVLIWEQQPRPKTP